MIGLIDADLLDNGTRFPNLPLMKISAYHNGKGQQTELLLNYDRLQSFDKVYLSKVFSYTNIPIQIREHKNIVFGGSGFGIEYCGELPAEIEHHMPDYNLYNKFVEQKIAKGVKPSRFSEYKDYSIGFTTRGCFRKCGFCINKKYDKACRHAKVSEFFDTSRKHICLLDDNILAYGKWREVFDELAETGRRFQFKQGLDIRLMDEEKAKVLKESKWEGSFIFAFDHIKDSGLIEEKLGIWRKYNTKRTKLYLLCAYESQGATDIENIFKRLKILKKYNCLPYLMRYESYKNSEFQAMYIAIARWCNQPHVFDKMSFRQFCAYNQEQIKSEGKECSSMRSVKDFELKYPSIAAEYFDAHFGEKRSIDMNKEVMPHD